MKRYLSNTLAGSCNQSWFAPEPGEVCTGRVFYRLYAGGTWEYRLFFSNVIDSTFADGTHSAANRILPPWTILGARVSVCREPEPGDFLQLLFDGLPRKQVAPGEFFACDPIILSAEAGDYLCLEMTFSGTEIPYLPEAVIPVERLKDGAFVPDTQMPLAYLVGCDRPVKEHFVFAGDSITMGCGTEKNSYTHWAARIAELAGEERAWWDIGIGFGRGYDMASLGAWMFKAKQGDFVNLCYGVNDLLFGRTDEEILRDLHRITDELDRVGIRYGLFTLPPFHQTGETEVRWRRVNAGILREFDGAAYVFDTVRVLGKEAPEDTIPRFGGHPNAEGCELLAKEFVAFAKEKGIF